MQISRVSVRVVAILAVAALPILYGTWSQAQFGSPAPPSVRIGFGSVRGESTTNGLGGLVQFLTEERLVALAPDGRPRPLLADRWSVSDDGLTWTIHIRGDVKFHNGDPLTSDRLVEIMQRELPGRMGKAFADVAAIRATMRQEVQVVLHRRSNLFLESLDFSVVDARWGGTSAYRRGGELELLANDDYWGTKAAVRRIAFVPYDSIRAAWADMLRGQVDALFEAGSDAADFLAASSQVRLFEFSRRYAYEVLLNIHKPGLADPEVRRRLNRAIDRDALVTDGLSGHGRPEDSPLWPRNWALTQDLARVTYDPAPLDQPLRLTCLLVDPATDRLALAVQRQLAVIGVELALEHVSLDEWNRRFQAGDYDATLIDALRGPNIQRSVRFWYTGNLFNTGHYSSRAVDAAIDAIRDSTTDDGYRHGVATLNRALIDDPPAIFLVWGDSVRAVSRRFDVPPDSTTDDVLFTIGSWRIRETPWQRLTH